MKNKGDKVCKKIEEKRIAKQKNIEKEILKTERDNFNKSIRVLGYLNLLN